MTVMNRIPEVEVGDEGALLPLHRFLPRIPQPQGTYGAVPVMARTWCPACSRETIVIAQTLTLADPLDLVMVACWYACRRCGNRIPGAAFNSRIHYYEHPWVLALEDAARG